MNGDERRGRPWLRSGRNRRGRQRWLEARTAGASCRNAQQDGAGARSRGRRTGAQILPSRTRRSYSAWSDPERAKVSMRRRLGRGTAGLNAAPGTAPRSAVGGGSGRQRAQRPAVADDRRTSACFSAAARTQEQRASARVQAREAELERRARGSSLQGRVETHRPQSSRTRTSCDCNSSRRLGKGRGGERGRGRGRGEERRSKVWGGTWWLREKPETPAPSALWPAAAARTARLAGRKQGFDNRQPLSLPGDAH